MNQTAFTLVVPCAGSGKRMQSDIAKQYLTINNKRIIEHTLTRLLSHPKIEKVIVVLSADDDIFHSLDIAADQRVITVIGGAERSDSVFAGINQVADNDWVLVHDAARPCVSHADISNLIGHCTSTGVGAILATPVKDTMKRSNDNLEILHTTERNNLWHAQTPQMYLCGQLKSAMQQASEQGFAITDESSAIESAGIESHIVSGREDNIKITRPGDLNLAAFILSEQEGTCV